MSKKIPKNSSMAGFSGHFRCILQKGIDEDGNILQYEDLFDKNNNPTGEVFIDKTFKNKILKRGLSYIIQRLLQGHAVDSSGYHYGSHDIDSGTINNNPFQAICLVSDDTSYYGDAMVEFDESDAASNPKIAPGSGSVGKGRRGALLSTTTGTDLKVVSVSYPGTVFDMYYNLTSGIYTQIEYVIFAQANTVANETGDGAVDNFPIKSIGMAHTVACGSGEVGSQWGSRAVFGLKPTLQGISDRSYQHEGTGLLYYTGSSTTITSDGYVVSSQADGYGAEKCFDGYSQQEGLNGVVDLGVGFWEASTVAVGAVGRIWSSTKSIKGIRIIFPSEENIDHTPDDFYIDYLDPTANGNNPRPANDADWVNISTHTSEASNIYTAGKYGYEYVFSSTASCKGIRISHIYPSSLTVTTKIAEFMIFEEMTSVTLSSDTLKLAVDGVPNYKIFYLEDVSSTVDVNDIVDSINSVVDGYGIEAERSEFGYLWVRGSVAGDNSKLDLDSVSNGSTANADLGLWAAGGQKIGTTQALTKLPENALAIIYRIELTKRG